VIVFSDSQSSTRKFDKINAFSSQQNVIKAHEYAEQLYEINVKTRIEWVPSHSDIKYNEIVDKLAKEAIAMTDNNENTEYVSHIRRNARATTKTNWFVE
jgi:ribonuclease HI